MQQHEEISSTAQRLRRRRRRKVTARFYRFVALLILLFVASSYGVAIWRVQKVDRQIEMTRRTLNAVRMRNAQLLEELERVSSDEYVERVAREELGLVAEGETVFVVIKPEESVSPLEVERRNSADRIDGW
ncbi:MAG: septum formation initiator family protein [Firmicutes bacterium]|jgi:cell division protein FtsB/cell division protein DivIC|nr:septum formation initiator family protein [Bacillota bacterium]